MLIQYCSDLHLEFPVNQKYVQANPIDPKGEILVLAGDIVPFSEMDKHKEFFDTISGQFEQTFWIPGNHEFYGSDITDRSTVMNERIRSNVSLVNNHSVEYKNVCLVFSTMWSRIGVGHEREILKSMADFRLIKNNGKILSIGDYNAMHEACKGFLLAELEKKSSLTTIVATHHVPTFLNYPEKFKNSPINEAFAVELFDLIEASEVRYWIFGHTHEIVPDFTIGRTVLTTNQHGYVQYNEHLNFKRDKVLNVSEDRFLPST